MEKTNVRARSDIESIDSPSRPGVNLEMIRAISQMSMSDLSPAWRKGNDRNVHDEIKLDDKYNNNNMHLLQFEAVFADLMKDDIDELYIEGEDENNPQTGMYGDTMTSKDDIY